MVNILILENATIVTGLDNNIIDKGTIVVKNDLIEKVGIVNLEDFNNMKKEVINLSGMTILPGLIDTHIHLVGNGEISVFINLFESSIKRCVKAVRYLRTLLEMGITTVRSGGDGNSFFEMALRDAINEGYIEGPRLLATGYHLTATGGHAYFLPPWTDESNCVGLRCDGEDSFRKAARLQLAYGADSIKITCSRGLEEHDDPWTSELTVKEIVAAVDEAHRREKLAIAHAMGSNAIKNALVSGVDSIVHGFWLNEECASLMINKGVFWEPTLLYPLRIIDSKKDNRIPSFYIDNCKRAVEWIQNNFICFVKFGVKITLGTDCGGTPLFYHGENAKELEYMVNLGLKPLDAIIAATRQSAECLHLSDQIGTLEPGKKADMLIVEGNPTENIKILADKEKIKGVLKGGKKIVWKLK